jgi:thymidylate kinase
VIYVLEGADGTGKSTLANEIAAQKKTSVIHSYFDPSWDIRHHHMDMLDAALKVSKWRPVVLDRWAHSELVYGTVFRGNPGYDVQQAIKKLNNRDDIVWIICENDNTIQNHLRNRELRNEMFDDMSDVVLMFRSIVRAEEFDGTRKWIHYDFDKVDMTEFVKELPGENFIS